MKLQGAAIERFLAAPSPAVRAIVVFGPDEGLVRERAQQLGKQIVSDLNDPFRVAVLTAEALAAEPALLPDEASALSLMGGRRLIRIRDGSDKVTRAVTALLGSPTGDSLTVIEAGDLPTRSSLRKLTEDSPIAAAIPCYVEDEAGLARALAGQIAQAGKTIDEDALRLLAASLVGDRMAARGEVEKLILYMGEERSIGVPHVAATVADTAALDMDDVIGAAMAGDFAALDRSIDRVLGEGISGVGLLRMMQNHVRRLHLTRARVDAGAQVDRAMSSLFPPVFYKAKDNFAREVRRWPLERLAAALERLVEAEAKSKRTGADDALLAADALFAIARAAGASSRDAAR
jgi:DNA polymerase-3 subunit delta